MAEKTILIKKRNVYGIALIFLALSFFFIAQNASPMESSGTKVSYHSLDAKFNSMRLQNTNQCSGSAFIDLKDDNARLQGSCCGPMDFHRYTEQVEGLKKYSSVSKIPPDPYDIPVSLARELLDYQKNIVLNSEQQDIYDKAMKMSHEGGPCCCKCWRWYAFEGLAKYLITEHGFGAEQIAEVWDLEDGCGGSGHSGHDDIET